MPAIPALCVGRLLLHLIKALGRCMSVAHRIYSNEAGRREAVIPLLEEFLRPCGISISREYKMVEASRVC